MELLIVGLVLVSASLPLSAQTAGQESRIKVHKYYITVSGPDADGLVTITGSAGAVESTSPVRCYIKHLDTDVKTPVIVQRDGSFLSRVPAGAGERIRVYARNRERKQSYGTFTIPEQSATGSSGGGEAIGGDGETLEGVDDALEGDDEIGYNGRASREGDYSEAADDERADSSDDYQSLDSNAERVHYGRPYEGDILEEAGYRDGPANDRDASASPRADPVGSKDSELNAVAEALPGSSEAIRAETAGLAIPDGGAGPGGTLDPRLAATLITNLNQRLERLAEQNEQLKQKNQRLVEENETLRRELIQLVSDFRSLEQKLLSLVVKMTPPEADEPTTHPDPLK